MYVYLSVCAATHMSVHWTHTHFELLANDFYRTVNDVHAHLLYMQTAATPRAAWDMRVLQDVVRAYNATHDLITQWLRTHPLENTPPIPSGPFIYSNCQSEYNGWRCDAHVNMRAAIFFASYDRIAADGYVLHTDGRVHILNMLELKKAALDEWVSCFRATDAEWPLNPSLDRCFQPVRWGESRAGSMIPFLFPGGTRELPPSTLRAPPIASHAGARGPASYRSARAPYVSHTPARGAGVSRRYSHGVRAYGNGVEMMYSSDDDAGVFEGYGQQTIGETELRKRVHDNMSRLEDDRAADLMLEQTRKISRMHAQNPYVIAQLSAHLHEMHVDDAQPRTVPARQ